MKPLFILSFALIFTSCKQESLVGINNQTQTALPSDQQKAMVAAAADDWVWTGNQASNQIEIYDPAVADWNSASALKWSWKPVTTKGYSQYAVDHWGLPTDFKVRTVSTWGGNHLVSSCSNGLVTIAAYPAGTKKWAYNLGFNPHGVELLPNGNIAVAATDKDSVLLFASSTGTDNLVHAAVRLNKAHSVLYDPVENILWATGNDFVIAMQVGGTNSAPTLTELPARRGLLNTTSSANPYGHDLSRDLGDNNILWIGTNGGAYSYNKTTKVFTNGPGGATGINKTMIKAISRQNSGLFVITRPDSEKTTELPDPVTDPTWCTRYVDFYSSAGVFQYYRTKSGAKFYRAKIFRTPY
ncbi:hypothetical protein F0L74_13540 [Chitinophaga agrisoli]|uniref:WD40 repeat protein n=1 Tax=Chitinophaga agrisoli TaxID=2607653 RepID=A0A5B2VY86_9BACT|nr:DUF6528 family protein [Chitinophaga agrisoli]KAA2243510.1 hypothetical protein F0L74_13540 [Chitinophaga agrisoli]